MDILELNKELICKWDDFCLKSTNAWFWHTTKWLDYCASYSQEKYSAKNMSFCVTDETGILAICPLLLEARDGHNEFSAAGAGLFGAGPAFRDDLHEDRLERIQRTILAEVDRLAKENSVKRSLFRLIPLAGASNYNWLLKYGYLDASLNTKIIDLSQTETTIWNSLRKGHKYDVNRGKKYYQVNIFGKDNADKDIFDQYRLLHHKAAGCVTRPIETFEMMYRWIRSGEGILCGLSKDERYVGFSFINVYKDAAYYSSASDDPDFKTDIPISHIIQWSVIRWLKENGIKSYEIGVQQFGPLIHDIPTPKDLSISFFKRGFGGKTVPLFRGEKYYDQEYMRVTFKDRVRRFNEFRG